MAAVGRLAAGVAHEVGNPMGAILAFLDLAGRDPQALFRDLHAHGVATTASFIVGLDCQTPENLEEDIQRLVDIEPTLLQVASLSPPPGLFPGRI